MEQLLKLTEYISGIVWGWPMIVMLLGTHIFLTLRLKFPQRKIWTAIRLSVRKDKGFIDKTLDEERWRPY